MMFHWLKRRTERRAELSRWYKDAFDPQNPSYWIGKMLNLSGTSTSSGVVITEERALAISAVWCAVNLIAGAIGYMPLKVFQRVDDNNEPASDHPVYELLHRRANPCMNAMVFKETLMGHLLMHGNAYAEIERDGTGRPLALWPIPPTMMSVEVKSLAERTELLYRAHMEDGAQVELRPWQVLHIMGLSPTGFRGHSVIEHAADSWGLSTAVEEFGAKFFRNGVYPSGVLETDGALNQKMYEELKKSFGSDNSGLSAAHRTLILQHGLKWHQIGASPEAAQFLLSRKYNVEDVARWFNVPAYMLQQDSGQVRATIEQKSSDFVQWCLMPWCERWESELNHKLFGANEQETYFAEFVPQSLLRADIKTQAEVNVIYLQNGVYSVNEVRRMLNMSSVKDGDTYRTPANLNPLSPSGQPGAPDKVLDPAKSTTANGEDDNG